MSTLGIQTITRVARRFRRSYSKVGEAQKTNEVEDDRREEQDSCHLTRQHIHLINLTSPAWILKGKMTRCLAHKQLIGAKHLCDPELRDIGLPQDIR